MSAGECRRPPPASTPAVRPASLPPPSPAGWTCAGCCLRAQTSWAPSGWWWCTARAATCEHPRGLAAGLHLLPRARPWLQSSADACAARSPLQAGPHLSRPGCGGAGRPQLRAQAAPAHRVWRAPQVAPHAVGACFFVPLAPAPPCLAAPARRRPLLRARRPPTTGHSLPAMHPHAARRSLFSTIAACASSSLQQTPSTPTATARARACTGRCGEGRARRRPPAFALACPPAAGDPASASPSLMRRTPAHPRPFPLGRRTFLPRTSARRAARPCRRSWSGTSTSCACGGPTWRRPSASSPPTTSPRPARTWWPQARGSGPACHLSRDGSPSAPAAAPAALLCQPLAAPPSAAWPRPLGACPLPALQASSPPTLPHAVPDRHRGGAIELWGHRRLRRLLHAEPPFPAAFRGAPLVSQYSSLGGLDQKWCVAPGCPAWAAAGP